MEKLKKKNDISYYLLRILIFFAIIVLGTLAKANEMVIGEEKISPGINLVFEAAIKDDIEPKEFHLEEKDSDNASSIL